MEVNSEEKEKTGHRLQAIGHHVDDATSFPVSLGSPTKMAHHSPGPNPFATGSAQGLRADSARDLNGRCWRFRGRWSTVSCLRAGELPQPALSCTSSSTDGVSREQPQRRRRIDTKVGAHAGANGTSKSTTNRA